MADTKLNFKIITQDRVLVEEQVDAVFAKAVDGEFGILPNHIPFMTALDISVLRYQKADAQEYVSVIGGIFQVADNNVTILSDTAELGSEIDIARANAAKERAEARLRAGAKDVNIERSQIALQRALIRIKAASKDR